MSQTAASTVTATIIRGDHTVIDTVEPAWIDLCRQASAEGPFCSPTWIRAWLRAFSPASILTLVLLSLGERVVGIAPFIETTVGIGPFSFSMLSTIANDYVDRTALVLDPDHRDRALGALAQSLQDMHIPLISLRTVPTDGSMDHLVAAAAAAGRPVMRRTTHRMPYLAWAPTDDVTRFGPWKNIRRYRRKLQEGRYEARTTRPATLESLQRFFDVETESWKGEAGTDAGGTDASATFYRELVTSADPSFTTVVNEVIVDGRTIAASFGIDMHGVYYYLKGSYLPEYRSYGVGHINLQEILVSQVPLGTHEIDFLGTDDPYKLRWTESVRAHDHVMILPPGPLGRTIRPLLERGIPLVKQAKSRRRHAPSHPQE